MKAHSVILQKILTWQSYDAGYPLRDNLLVPYRGVRYHLAEWGRANVR
jgi:hypothetical protein